MDKKVKSEKTSKVAAGLGIAVVAGALLAAGCHSSSSPDYDVSTSGGGLSVPTSNNSCGKG